LANSRLTSATSARGSRVRQQAHAPQKVGEAAFSAQAVETRIGAQPDKPHIVLLATFFQPGERLRVLPQTRMDNEARAVLDQLTEASQQQFVSAYGTCESLK
jgi:hypothetical protein